MRRRSDYTTSSSRSQHSKSGGPIYVLSHPRTHKGSGDRPLRCIRVPLSDTPSTGKPWVFLLGGWTWVCQQICLFYFGGSADRTGWRAAGHGARAGGRGPTGGRTSEATNGSAELHISSFGCGPIAHPVALVHSIRILAARSIVLSHPRAHWVSGDRPLRCIREPLRDPPPPETRGVCFEGGWTWIGQQTCLFCFCLVCGSDGLAGGGPRYRGGRAGGHGGEQVRQNMDRHYYIYRLSGADNITYVVFRGRTILHMSSFGGGQYYI